MFLSLQSEEKKTDWYSVGLYCLYSSTASSCLLLFPSESISCLSASPFPVLSLSPSPIPPQISLFGRLSPSEGDTAPRHAEVAVNSGSTSCLWKQKNYTVTFPAFLLKISYGGSLSKEDRDPGGGETGCSSNHFLSHHFLQVDSMNFKNLFQYTLSTQYFCPFP